MRVAGNPERTVRFVKQLVESFQDNALSRWYATLAEKLENTEETGQNFIPEDAITTLMHWHLSFWMCGVRHDRIHLR